MEVVVGWILFSVIVGLISKNKTIGFWGGFTLSLILSPIIGLIIALLSKDKVQNYYSNPDIFEPSFKKVLQDKMESVDREIFKGNKEKALDILMDMAYDIHKRMTEHQKYENVKKFESDRIKIIEKINELGGTVPNEIKGGI